jgi:heme-degrading monooxygenase HmoA
VTRFAEFDIFERSRESGGFLGGRLLRPLTDGAPFIVVAEWESSASYQDWLDNPRRAELSAAFDDLLAGEVPAGEVFEAVHSASSMR